MKKYFAILLSFSLLAVFFPSITLAQAQLNQIPNVFVKNIHLQKTDLRAGETVSGTFEALTDSRTGVSDIYFKISLVGNYQKNMLAGASYGSTLTASSYEIKAGETKTVSFSYTIPQAKTGTGYGIQIQGVTKAGVPLGWSDAFVKITNTGNAQYLSVVRANLTVDGKTFGIQAGPMVPSGKKAVLDIVIGNSSAQSVTLTPTIDLYNHVVLGKPLSTTFGSSTTIDAGKQKEIFITLPTDNNTPLVYVSRVTFFDSNKAQRLAALDTRYIVQGDIATIQTVSTNKHSFNQGDTVAVTLGFSGTPFDITTGNNEVDATYDTKVSLLDDQNQSIALWTGKIDYNATSSKTVVLTAQQAANGYTVDVSVSKLGKIITHYSSKISPETITSATSTSTDWQYILYGIILIVILVVILIVLMRRDKRVGGAVLFLFLLAGLSYVALDHSKINKAEAQVMPLSGSLTFQWVKGSRHMGDIAVTASSPIVGTYFTPGQNFSVNGSVYSRACTNQTYNLTTTLSIKDASGNVIFTSTAAPFSSEATGGENDYYLTSQYAIPVQAPSTPGQYTIVLSLNSLWGSNVAATWEGTQSFTVVAPTISCSAAPENSTLCPGAADGLDSYTQSNVVDSCGSAKCEYTCVSGSVKVGNACIAQNTPTLSFAAVPSVPTVGVPFNLNWALSTFPMAKTSSSLWGKALGYLLGGKAEANVVGTTADGHTCTATAGTDSWMIPSNKSVEYGDSATQAETVSAPQTISYTLTCRDGRDQEGTPWGISPISKTIQVTVGCPSGQVAVGGVCTTPSACPNGAINPADNPSCSICPVGKTMYGGRCEMPNACAPWVTVSGNSHIASYANVGQLVEWKVATATGAYTWSENSSGVPVLGTPGQSFSTRYSTIGNKTMYLKVGDASPVTCTTMTNGLPNGLPVVNNPGFQEF